MKGASKGEGLGNQFLANIRECDSIVQVSSGAAAPACWALACWPVGTPSCRLPSLAAMAVTPRACT